LHDLYIEEEDFDSLRNSTSKFQNFDSAGLAKRLAVNDLLEFKRIAAGLYKQNKRWKQSIELSKADNLYKDAMETAAESKDREIAEDLLRFFVEPQFKVQSAHCFAACLYTCYGLIKPDVALELAWRYKLIDFSFPFLIQFLKEYTQKVDELYSAAHPKDQGDGQETNPTLTNSAFGTNNMLGTQGSFVPMTGMGMMMSPQVGVIPQVGVLPQGGILTQGGVIPQVGVLPQGGILPQVNVLNQAGNPQARGGFNYY